MHWINLICNLALSITSIYCLYLCKKTRTINKQLLMRMQMSQRVIEHYEFENNILHKNKTVEVKPPVLDVESET